MQGLALLLAIAFLFAELGIAQLIGAPFLDTELFQLGIRDGFARLDLVSQHMIGYSLLFQGALIRPQFLIQLFAAARKDFSEPLPSPTGLGLAFARTLLSARLRARHA